MKDKPTNTQDNSLGATNNEMETDNLKKSRTKKEKKPWSVKKRVIIFSSIGIVLIVLLGCFAFLYNIWNDPMGQFENVSQKESFATAKRSITATETPRSAKEESIEQILKDSLRNIVNIMLIGVDYSPGRNKRNFHADVMIVLAINTEKNEIHLISLPRDTYAKIPGVNGIYKLNASIDCGGGWPTPSGFEKVCEAASWMLGGIPVNYYYAIDMEAVKGLVDEIGGVDYNVDVKFEGEMRYYKEGFQHMDGQAVLDYLRVRKNLGSESGDLNRINRQKKMLAAIFNKLKESGLISTLPDILKEFNGNLYTNTTFAQTTGLVAFTNKIGSDKILMHSMDGRFCNIFNWNFVITDQDKRVKLIKEIYGVEVPQYREYSYIYATELWKKMQRGVKGRVNYERDSNEIYVDFN